MLYVEKNSVGGNDGKVRLIKLQETEDRSKSNTKRIDEHDANFKEAKHKLEDTHELTYASVRETAFYK